MINLEELNELYKTPESYVAEDVWWALQWVDTIWDYEYQEKAYAQTGVINPEPVHTWWRWKSRDSVEWVPVSSNQSNQQSPWGNIVQNQQVPQWQQQIQPTINPDVDPNWSVPVVPPVKPDKIYPWFETKPFINPVTGDVKIWYLKPNPKLTPEEQQIVNYIPKDKKPGDAKFNSDWLVSGEEVQAVLNVVNKFSDQIPQDALNSMVWELQYIWQIQDPYQRLDALNKFKVKLWKFLEDSKLPWRLYAKWDPQYELLYWYIEKAKKLNSLIFSDGSQLISQIENNAKSRFEIWAFNPKDWWTSIKAKVELWSNPIFQSELQRLRAQSPELYYVLEQEKDQPTLWTYEKKILRKIYDSYVKPLSSAYYQVKKVYWEQTADKMFPQYKQLKNLTDLRYRTYLDDVLDKLYQPIDMDASNFNFNLWKSLSWAYSMETSPISSRPSTWYTTYSSSYRRPTYQKPVRETVKDFNWINF